MNILDEANYLLHTYQSPPLSPEVERVLASLVNEIDRLKSSLSDSDRAETDQIRLTDHREEQIHNIYNELGGELEWSSWNDLGVEGVELAALVISQLEQWKRVADSYRGDNCECGDVFPKTGEKCNGCKDHDELMTLPPLPEVYL